MAFFVKGCLTRKTIVDLSHRDELLSRDEIHPLRLARDITSALYVYK